MITIQKFYFSTPDQCAKKALEICEARHALLRVDNRSRVWVMFHGNWLHESDVPTVPVAYIYCTTNIEKWESRLGTPVGYNDNR